MAPFSFGKFFRKNPRQTRFDPAAAETSSPVGTPAEGLPVGRLVSFTDHGPEDAPLFQELDNAVAASPFMVVGGTRPSALPGGLPGSARLPVEEGFTADELAAMVPPHCVRTGAVPPTRIIHLPHGVLRASLAAGQPAVLLSQLHQACPELFVAPSSLDQDLVIALPPHKVQRLVSRTEPSTPVPAPPLPRPSPVAAPQDGQSAFAWTEPLLAGPFDDAAAPPFAVPPSKIKLPPPRRKFDDPLGADLRPLIEKPAAATPAVPFMELGSSPFPSAARPEGPAVSLPAQRNEAAGFSPFQVTSALPSAQQSLGKPLAQRFESPFSIVSPGEVPSVLESPFARHPLSEFEPPPAAPASPEPEPMPEPPSTVSLRLTALLQGQPEAVLGFTPERVPASVRVTLATGPLLAQVASGRVRVSLDDVLAGLDPKFKPAFQQARPGMEFNVPLRELFDNLPEATPPTPAAAPVESIFQTPFSLGAEDDLPLTPEHSPFLLLDAVAGAAPVVPVASTPPLPASPPPLPEAATAWSLPPAGKPADAPDAALADSFILLPDQAAASPTLPEPDRLAPAATTPFLLVPSEPESPAEMATVRSEAPAPPRPMNAVAHPTEFSLPPLRNPFALAPGEGSRAGLGLELSLMPYDEDPVPLESLREEEICFGQAPLAAPSAREAEPTPPVAPPLPEKAAIAPAPAAPPPIFSFTPPSAETQPTAAPAPPASTPATPPPATPAAAEVSPPAFGAYGMFLPTEPEPEPEPIVLSLESGPAAVGEPPMTGAYGMFLPTEPEPAAITPAPGPSPDAAPPAAPAPSSPFLTAATFQLPPLPMELLGSTAAPVPAPPPSVPDVPPASTKAPPIVAEDSTLLPPGLAEAPPFNLAPPSPTADDRAAFAFAFAPSTLAQPSAGTAGSLGDMDTVPAIALAKLPPLEEPAAAEPRAPFSRPTSHHAAPTPAPSASGPIGFSFSPSSPAPASQTPVPPIEAEPEPRPAPTAKAPTSPTAPPPSWAVPAPTAEPAGLELEDLSFGYVDDPTQLALRAVFATDQTLGTQDVVDQAARLDGLRACLAHTPHASLHSASSAADTDDVRHFRDRAGALFEKTASLVRELDPTAREQSFTLRTAKGVVSFFAVGDVCLAVLHAEPSFRPGVREKLTLVARSLADMLNA